MRIIAQQFCASFVLAVTAAVALGYIPATPYAILWMHFVFWPALVFAVVEGVILLLYFVGYLIGP